MKKKSFDFDRFSKPLAKSKHPVGYAVGLGYDQKHQPVPILTAAGKSQEAVLIERIARRYGVPVHKNAELASELAELELEEEISQSHFSAVASVFAKIEKS